MKRVFKLFAIILIVSFILPFYNGNTSSGLNRLDFVHNKNTDITADSMKDSQIKPPAKVTYDNTDIEKTIVPVQVMPVPDEHAGQNDSPGPDPAQTPLPSPAPGSDLTDTNQGINNPEKESLSENEPDSGPDNHDTNETDETIIEEVAANSGKLLQHLLDGIYQHTGEKVAYLTFDDGPTPHLTERILDILKEDNVKATFFPIGYNAEAYPKLIKKTYDEGHGIGNHTYSHVYRRIYSKPGNLVDEFIKTEEILQSILGEDKSFKLVRFPGGSFGNTLKPFREAANKAGFGYIDWNCVNGDAESVKRQSAKKLFSRVRETYREKNGLIVLMHDAPGKETTADALPEIIQFLRKKGYRFELLPGSR